MHAPLPKNGSNRSPRNQVHLLHWLESNVYGVFLSDKRSTSTSRSIYKGIKVKRMVYLSDWSDFKAGRNY